MNNMNNINKFYFTTRKVLFENNKKTASSLSKTIFDDLNGKNLINGELKCIHQLKQFKKEVKDNLSELFAEYTNLGFEFVEVEKNYNNLYVKFNVNINCNDDLIKKIIRSKDYHLETCLDNKYSINNSTMINAKQDELKKTFLITMSSIKKN